MECRMLFIYFGVNMNKDKFYSIIGKRLQYGCRPYPYVYYKSEGIVTSVSIDAGRVAFYTDKGEEILPSDLDLVSEVLE